MLVVRATVLDHMSRSRSGPSESQKVCIEVCRPVGSALGLARYWSRNCCIPFGPAKSGRESRSKNCVIFLALLTICAAFKVSGSYLLWSASLAVGIAPVPSAKYWVWTDPLARYSMNAFAWPLSLLKVGDFLVTM